MATLAPDRPAAMVGGDERYFFKMVCVMAAVMVAGFSMQFLMGRSSFAAPLRVHAHAVIFFGWIVLFVTQANAAMRRDLALHRKLGRIAALWIVLMLVAAMVVTIALAREGRVPFFFYPQQFIIADPASLLCFAGVTAYAVSQRHRRDWHMRLQICAFVAIMGPGFGRLLPMPLLAPYAFEVAAVVGLIFPVVGMLRDRKVHGAVHPAWWRGIAAVLAMIVVFDTITYSPLGDALYQMTVAGSAGEAVPGLALPPPPPM